MADSMFHLDFNCHIVIQTESEPYDRTFSVGRGKFYATNRPANSCDYVLLALASHNDSHADPGRILRVHIMQYVTILYCIVHRE